MLEASAYGEHGRRGAGWSLEPVSGDSTCLGGERKLHLQPGPPDWLLEGSSTVRTRTLNLKDLMKVMSQRL